MEKQEYTTKSGAKQFRPVITEDDVHSDRYLGIVQWALARYTYDGVLIISRGLQPSTYSRIEELAFRRYMEVK